MTEVQTVLITGGSRGIGYELARLFARDMYRVILVARSEEHLHTAAAELRKSTAAVDCWACDLSRPSAQDEIFKRLRDEAITLDVLVNNAGFGTYGRFAETDLQTELALIQVNITALTHLTKLAVRDMVPRGCGRILNIASTAAFEPGPLMAVYYASKAYVLSFSEALHNELRGTGVTATTICPGPTRTGFQSRAGVLETRLFTAFGATAADVARAGYEGMLRGDRLVVPGLMNKLGVIAVKLAPRALTLRAVRWLQESKRESKS